jgi:CRISPR-associated protein Cas4
MFCLREMGYEVDSLAFYETSTNKMIPVAMPNESDEGKFTTFVYKFRNYNPEDCMTVNPNKCRHCIYCNLCDRTNVDNVYT